MEVAWENFTGVNTKKQAMFEIILAIYRFYLGDKVDDFYLDRLEGFNIKKKMSEVVNIEHHSKSVDQAESVSGKNKRTFENTIQDYEQENDELDMLDNKPKEWDILII
jgi:hypothetical protein